MRRASWNPALVFGFDGGERFNLEDHTNTRYTSTRGRAAEEGTSLEEGACFGIQTDW